MTTADRKPSSFVEENPPKDETKTAKQAEAKQKPPTSRQRKPKQAGRPSKQKQRQKQLQDVLETMGTAIAIFDPPAGMIILDRSENVAEAWADLAEKEAKVAAALDRMFTGGAYANVTIATAGMILPLLMHYGLFPKGLMNPFTLGQDGEDGDSNSTVG